MDRSGQRAPSKTLEANQKSTKSRRLFCRARLQENTSEVESRLGCLHVASAHFASSLPYLPCEQPLMPAASGLVAAHTNSPSMLKQSQGNNSLVVAVPWRSRVTVGACWHYAGTLREKTWAEGLVSRPARTPLCWHGSAALPQLSGCPACRL